MRAWKRRISLPVLTFHTMSACVWSASGLHVTRKVSHGEKSISLTPPWLILRTFFHDGPPHSMRPSRWKVTRKVPIGDQRT